MDYPIIFVILMGLGVVFFGLICIILLCMLMSVIVRKLEARKPAEAPKSAAAASPSPAPVSLTPDKRRELIAAISAVIAEDLGTDVSAIRVTSFKQV